MMLINHRINFIFMLVMSIGLFISNHLFGVGYLDPKFSSTFLPTYYFLVPFSIWAYITYGKTLPSGLPHYLLSLIVLVPIGVMSIFTISHLAAWSLTFLLPMIDALFVGISEELVYRGVIFSRMVPEKGLLKATFLSALFFSVLHSVNVIGGLSLTGMLSQLISTFMAGLFFALFYYYTKNIYLIILYHFLFDYMLFTDITIRFPIISQGYQFLTMLEIALTLYLLYHYRKKRKTGNASC